jgi:hypothetical protein
MDPTLATVLRWAAIIIVVILCGWFILEVIDRIDDDVNSGMILWDGLL